MRKKRHIGKQFSNIADILRFAMKSNTITKKLKAFRLYTWRRLGYGYETTNASEYSRLLLGDA